jgi:hypothetical protein
VFVCYVQIMSSVKGAVPCRIGLKTANFLNDLGAGELYLSLLTGGFKSRAASVLGEGELDSVGLSGPRSGHPKECEVKGASDVVNCVSYDERELWGDGLLFLESRTGYPAGVVWRADYQFGRILCQNGLDSPVEIIDVMVGPL